MTISCSFAYAQSPAPSPKRPAIKTNRWQEDWSALSDPSLKTEPLDDLKYIGLPPDDPDSYVSFGLTLRERYEVNTAPGFGIAGGARDSYLLQRAQIHIDTHFNENWQLFTQFEDVRAFGKADIGGADENELDLRLAFLGYSETFDAGTFKGRVGRQDFAFDLQRFVSSRDGPNVRQSFDAVWADWESGPWRLLGFVSQPVQYRNDDPFDDTSNGRFTFSTIRLERQVFGTNELSAYYALYDRDDAHYLDAAGDEERHVFDARFAGSSHNFDWDLEGMGQLGTVGSSEIRAWAMGARAGYTFADASWTPRVGLQFDIASGDRNRGDGTVETFNPLFPNGYYFTLGGYTGYSNLIHVKPSITVKPAEKLSVTTAVGLLWRMTTADAVYTQPSIPVAGTAGHGDAWTGAYVQLRADYAFTPNLTGALEAVHYDAGSTIRNAGGHDGNYLGAELKFSW
ncbi:alginate export family protein [Rhizobium bangladeshense]|uniref:alginate export family protein n=1 Tax=Rhizobium bangladeshense TaxID=1138189 RepID=UPI002180A957|nr:alginate export family protein [Rhizobium bangladeshense]